MSAIQGPSRLHTPLHVGSINGNPVRFFRPPFKDGRPDFPWTAFEDLMVAFGASSEIREYTRAGIRDMGCEQATMLPTPEGLVMVVPHFAAQGFVQAMAEAIGIDEERAYTSGVAKAFNTILGDIPPLAMLDYSVAAFNRWSN